MTFNLVDSYQGESLLSGFDWFNGSDLSNGFVSYQSREDAEAQGLYSLNDETQVVRLGVDHTNTYRLDEGRPSIRIESKQSYNHGLFIADFLHMPHSHCGVWPAFWQYGNEWPGDGEIDIIEGANTAHNNLISAHTAEGCFQDESLEGLYSGNLRNTECFIGDQNIGCGFDPPVSAANTYGDGFNAAGGGVYTVYWDDEYIRLWHFTRSEIPEDIRAKKPDPQNWGLPHAIFGGNSCDVDSYFKDMSLVINTNFCGDYGNAVWGKMDSCDDFAPTCPEYVANNPEAFTNAYWDIKYIDVYSWDGDRSPIEPTTTTTMTSFSTTTLTVGGGSSDNAASGSDASPTNPVSIDGYAHLGCFGSTSHFHTFNEIDESSDMTLDKCTDLCKPISFAGISGNKCLCAEAIDSGTRLVDSGHSDTQCSQPCPGNDKELCGGIGGGESGFLTIYGVVKDEGYPQPPPMAGAMPGDARIKMSTPDKTCHKEMDMDMGATPVSVPDQTELPVVARPVGTPTPVGTPPAVGGNSTIPVPVAAAMDRRGPGKLSVVAGVIVMGVMMVM